MDTDIPSQAEPQGPSSAPPPTAHREALSHEPDMLVVQPPRPTMPDAPMTPITSSASPRRPSSPAPWPQPHPQRPPRGPKGTSHPPRPTTSTRGAAHRDDAPPSAFSVALTCAFAFLAEKASRDRAKSVPSPSQVEPLTLAFLIRASPTRHDKHPNTEAQRMTATRPSSSLRAAGIASILLSFPTEERVNNDLGLLHQPRSGRKELARPAHHLADRIRARVRRWVHTGVPEGC